MRTVMLTGAAGNLGRAVAAAFSDANLVLLDLKRGSLQESERQMFIAADLLDPKSVQAAVDQALARFRSIDVLCNIAGGFRMGSPVHETKDSDWDFLMGLNARSVLNASRAAVPAMLKGGGGKIVNIARGSIKSSCGSAFWCVGCCGVGVSGVQRSCGSGTSTSIACCRRSSIRRKTAKPCRTQTQSAGWRRRISRK